MRGFHMCRMHKNGHGIANHARGGFDIPDFELALTYTIGEDGCHQTCNRLGIVANQVGTFVEHPAIELINFDVVSKTLELPMMKGAHQPQKSFRRFPGGGDICLRQFPFIFHRLSDDRVKHL